MKSIAIISCILYMLFLAQSAEGGNEHEDIWQECKKERPLQQGLPGIIAGTVQQLKCVVNKLLLLDVNGKPNYTELKAKFNEFLQEHKDSLKLDKKVSELLLDTCFKNSLDGVSGVFQVFLCSYGGALAWYSQTAPNNISEPLY